MTIEVALFILNDRKDVYIFLAPKSALDWCLNVVPGEHTLPTNVLTELEPFITAEYEVDLDEEVEITIGSPDNDAAMHLLGLCKTFDTITDALEHVQLKGWQLNKSDEYHGYAY